MNNKQPARPQSIELSLPSIKLHAYRQICLKWYNIKIDFLNAENKILSMCLVALYNFNWVNLFIKLLLIGIWILYVLEFEMMVSKKLGMV